MGEAGSSQDLAPSIGYAGVQARVNQRQLATGPGRQVGSIELLDAQYLVLRTRDPRLAGDVRPKG